MVKRVKVMLSVAETEWKEWREWKEWKSCWA